MDTNPTAGGPAEALQRDPQDWSARLAYADALVAAGQRDQAAATILMAPADPVSEDHLVRAARHLLHVSPDRALALARKAEALDDSNARAALVCAEAYRLKNDHANAEKHYLVAVTFLPEIAHEAVELKRWLDAPPSAARKSTSEPVKLQTLDRSAKAITSEHDTSVLVVAEEDEPAFAVAPEPELDEPVTVIGHVAVPPAHADLLEVRPEKRRLWGQKLTAAATAVIIHVALFFLLGVLIIVAPSPPSAEITALVSPEQTQEKPETKQIVVPQPLTNPSVSRTTTSAIAAVGVSPIALPNFDFKAPAEPVSEIATTDLGNSFATAFQPKGTATVNFFGIKAKGRRIAFLIEAERYMLTDPKGGIPAYQIVKEEIASMISKFDVQTAFNVLMFDHFHLSAFSDKLVPATSANMAKVRDWLYPVNREYENLGLAAIKYPPMKTSRDVEPIRSNLLQGYMLAIQYALESDVDTVFIITSGWRWMNALETPEEREKFLKEQRWTDKEEKAWQAAVKTAQDWLKKENDARKAKGVPERVIRSINELISELRIPVRHKPGLDIDAETREEQVINAMRAIYSSQGKPKPQINFVLFVGKDEEVIPKEEHFEDIARRARSGKSRVLRGLAALKNVTGRS